MGFPLFQQLPHTSLQQREVQGFQGLVVKAAVLQQRRLSSAAVKIIQRNLMGVQSQLPQVLGQQHRSGGFA